MAHAFLTAAAGVTDAWARDAAERFGASAVTRVSDRAVRLEVPARDLPALPFAVDVTRLDRVAPARLLIADMDSTMITVECIDELADYAGVKSEVAAITAQAMAGAMAFGEALRARVALLEGLPVDVLEACYRDRVRATPGAEALVRGSAAAGALTALVSGGFTFFTERVGADLGFRINRANTLEEAGGKLTGRIVEPALGPAAKRDILQDLMAEDGIAASEVIAVGDGANDIEMVRAAGLGIGYRPKPALAAAADAVLRHSDLTAILAFQGLPDGG